jgi:peptide/nickel transport system substrate-binding protein
MHPRIRTAAVAAAILLGTTALIAAPASAKSLKVAMGADFASMDPHAKFEAPTVSFLLGIHDTLVRRNEKLEIEPALAVSWQRVSPTVVRYKLREGVKFHDGSALTADDVVFSFTRAMHPRAESRVNLAPVKEVRAIDPLTVEIESKGPDPLALERPYPVSIMSKAWAEKNGATQPVDAAATASTNASIRQAMGTGAFMLKSHEAGKGTVVVPNPNWWDKATHNVTEATYVPIPADATRTAALLSGEVDINLTPSPQDVERISRAPGMKVVQGPDQRVMLLSLDQARDELLESNVKGKNPLKDKRVRQAMYQAIDINTIKTRVMRGLSEPIGLMWAPGTNGYDKSLDTRFAYDPEASKKLLAEAGYPNGFEIGFDCPNDRYLNDEETCKAITAMFARVGIKANLNAQTRGKWFAKLLPNYETSMTIFGWASPTYDAGYTLTGLMSCRSKERNRGLGNLGGYCNPEFDRIVDASEVEMDPAKRAAMLRQATIIHRDEIGHIPLHTLSIVWGVKQNIEVVQNNDGYFLLRYVKIN